MTMLLRIVLATLAIFAIAGSPALIYFHTHPPGAPIPWSVIAATLLFAAVVGFAVAKSGRAIWRGLADWLARLPSGLLPPLVVGLGLRVAGQLILAPAAASDGLSYVRLASQLLRGGSYGMPGGLAFWPPGYPLILVPGVALGLPPGLWWGIVNAACFCLALLGARALLVELRVPSLHGLVYWSLALWPTHVLCSLLPVKELVILALLPWICCFALQTPRDGWRAALKSGLLTGVVVLTQPSLQFMAPGMLLMVLVFNGGNRRLLASAVVAVLAMMVVVAPWTLRNYLIFDRVVPVSSNGGDVLYRANNDLATGIYVDRASIDLDHLDELGKDAASKRHAVEWIKSHPVEFVQLGFSKLMHFMGDDSSGPYIVFKTGGVEVSRVAYLIMRQASALPWLVVWIVFLGWLWRAGKGAAGVPATRLLVVFFPIGYLALIHSVFESGPKYHLPLYVLVFVLLAAVGSSARATSR